MGTVSSNAPEARVTNRQPRGSDSELRESIHAPAAIRIHERVHVETADPSHTRIRETIRMVLQKLEPRAAIHEG
jgi:hypothetical protein